MGLANNLGVVIFGWMGDYGVGITESAKLSGMVARIEFEWGFLDSMNDIENFRNILTRMFLILEKK